MPGTAQTLCLLNQRECVAVLCRDMISYSTATRYRNAKGFKGIYDEPCKAAFKIGNRMHTMAQESRAQHSTHHHHCFKCMYIRNFFFFFFFFFFFLVKRTVWNLSRGSRRPCTQKERFNLHPNQKSLFFYTIFFSSFFYFFFVIRLESIDFSSSLIYCAVCTNNLVFLKE